MVIDFYQSSLLTPQQVNDMMDRFHQQNKAKKKKAEAKQKRELKKAGTK